MDIGGRITTCVDQVALSSTVTWAGRQHCQNVIGGEVIRCELMTLPYTTWGRHFHKASIIRGMLNFVALSAAVLMHFQKKKNNGGRMTAPVRARTTSAQLGTNANFTV